MNLAPPERAEVRRDLTVLALGCAVLFFIALGARDLWNPNEPSYGQAVTEMAERGDWCLPTVNGVVFAEKPILYYWLALGVSRLAGGVSEWTLRAPSAAAGVAGTLLVYLLVHPYTHRGRARCAALLFATQYLVWWSARWVQMDLLVSVTTLAAVFFAARTVDDRMRPALGWALAGAAAGAGFAAKGPVGFICPALAVGTYLASTRRLKILLGWGPLVGAMVAVAVASPWYLVLAARGETDALREVLIRQNISRVLDPWDHERAWWYYLKHFWIDFAPWVWFVPLAPMLSGRDDAERRLDRLAWGWIAATLLFFSISPSKRSPYTLPMAPAVAVLASGVLERFLEERLDRLRAMAARAVVAAGGIAAVVVGLYFATRLPGAYPEFSGFAVGCGALAVTGGILIAGCAAMRRSTAAVAGWIALVVSAYLFAAVLVLPEVNSRKSARSFCERVNAVVPAGATLVSFGMWEYRGSYAFYARRTIPNLISVDALRRIREARKPAYVIVEDGRLDDARKVLGAGEPLVRTTIGRTTAYLFRVTAANSHSD